MRKERKLAQKEKAKAKKCSSELPVAFRNYCLASEDVSEESRETTSLNSPFIRTKGEEFIC